MVGIARLCVGSLPLVVGLAFNGCGDGKGEPPAAPAVTAQRWGPAIALGTAEVTPGLAWPHRSYFAMAMNEAGDTTVVFDNLDHYGAPSLVAAHYDTRSRSWAAPAVLVGGSSGGASAPDSTSRLAMDASGNAFLLWNQSEYTAPARSVYASRFDARLGTWGSVVRLTDDMAGDAFAQDVAASEGAGALAAFFRTEAVPGLVARQYSGEWLPAGAFDLGPAAIFSRSRLAGDASGTVLAAWAEPGATGQLPAANELATRRHSARAGWGPKASVPLGGSVDAAGTRTIGDLAVASNGDAFLLWQDWSMHGPARIYASRFDSVAGWTAPSLLDTVDIGAQSVSVDPKRVQTGDRGLVLANWGPRFSRYEPSAGWAAPVQVLDSLATGLESWGGGQHQMTLDTAGNVLVIGRDAATDQPSFATYVFGRGWSEVSPLDAVITYDYTAFLVGNRRGGAAIAWAEGLDFVPLYCGHFARCTAPTRVRLWARFYE